MHLKICGLRDCSQARQVAELGVDAIGVIAVASSPRFVSAADRGPLFAAIAAAAPTTERVLVLANPSLEEVASLEGDQGPTVLQLHGQESPEQCRSIRERLQRPIWKALRIRHPDDLDQARIYADAVDALLLDAWVPDQLGGSGQRIPIEWLRGFAPSLPWWLAGGVRAELVSEILHDLRPWGLDASSSVEVAPADKDLAKVRQLIDAVRQAAA